MIICNSLGFFSFLRKFSFHFTPVDMLNLWNFLLFCSTDITPQEIELRDTFDAKILKDACVCRASRQSTVMCSELKERIEVTIRKGEGKCYRGGKFSNLL